MPDVRKFRVIAGSYRDRGRSGYYTDGKIRTFTKDMVFPSYSDMTALFVNKFKEEAADAPVTYVKAEVLKAKREQPPAAPAAPAAAAPAPESEKAIPAKDEGDEDVLDENDVDEDEDDEDEDEEDKPAKKPKIVKKTASHHKK